MSEDNNIATQTHSQRTITTFLSSVIGYNATSKSKATQMGSWGGHNKGGYIYLSWEFYRCWKPDSLVSFDLLYFYIYSIIFILCGCNLLLKDVNISFFLSTNFVVDATNQRSVRGWRRRRRRRRGGELWQCCVLIMQQVVGGAHIMSRLCNSDVFIQYFTAITINE